MTVHTLHAHRAEIRLAGSGGQGLITGMHILFRALAIAGKRTAEIEAILGYRGRDEMIHRDDLAMTETAP